jgi:hypothetical protein
MKKEETIHNRKIKIKKPWKTKEKEEKRAIKWLHFLCNKKGQQIMSVKKI